MSIPINYTECITSTAIDHIPSNAGILNVVTLYYVRWPEESQKAQEVLAQAAEENQAQESEENERAALIP